MDRRVRKLCTNTTAHGFNHLVEEGPNRGYSRMLWGLAISLSFGILGYLVVSSLQDAAQNPVVTTVEYVPVQGVPFPAVTMTADINKELHLLKYVILDQITYDCYAHEEDYEKPSECLEKSAPGRNMVRPLARFLMFKMFGSLKEVVITKEKSGDKKIQGIICGLYTSQDPGLQFINPLMESLSVPNDTTREQKVKVYLDHFADLFKAPWDIFSANMTELVQDHPHVSMTTWECAASHFKECLSHEAKAMALLLIKVLDDSTTWRIGHWSMMSLTDFFDDGPTIAAFHENFRDLHLQVYEAMENLIHSDDATFTDIVEHLIRTGFDVGAAATDDDNRRKMPNLYRDLLKVAKYTMRPLNVKMTEQERVRDMQDRLLRAINSTYGRQDPDSFLNHEPVLLYCSFGDEEDHQVCLSALTTFTTTGLGQSFNTQDFFQLYQWSSSMEAFCQEIIERTGQDLCTTKGNKMNKKIVPIKHRGSGFSLMLLLHGQGRDGEERRFPRMTLHSPYSIADTSDTGNYFEPIVGTHTTVVATPYVTVTDDSLLKEGKSRRRCHYQDADGNLSKLFLNHTKANCVFECHLDWSTNKCGCVPWNFPKLDPEARTCSGAESKCFLEALQSSGELASCSHCEDECWKVDFEYTIHTKPLKLSDICKNEKIKEAVGVVSNYNPMNFMADGFQFLEIGDNYQMIDSCMSYVEENTALVEVRIGPAKIVYITRMAKVTFPQQVANLGGLMGLCTGGSFLTIFDFIKWVLEIHWSLPA